ncbi:MAG: hypothetical protein IKH16_09195 [Selenomonadaceae bacterium]|nr:hypothetical protein [Selenomonadaceae bacterium]
MFGVILGSLSSVLGVVAKLMPTLVKIVGTELVTFAKALEAFFRVLGLLKPDEQVEEIGDKALQAEKDEVSPIQVKDFDSHEKYLEKLAEYEADSEKSALTTQDAKLQKGLEIMMGLAIEIFGGKMSELYPIFLKNPAFYSVDGRLEGIAHAVQSDKEILQDIAGYISGKSSDSIRNDRAFDALFDVEKNVHPYASDREISSIVENMREKK